VFLRTEFRSSDTGKFWNTFLRPGTKFAKGYMGLPPNIEPQESPLSLLMLLCEGDFNPPIMIHVTFLGLLVLNAVALKSSFSSSVAQHPKWRLDRLNFAVSRSHKNRYTQPAGLL